MNYLNSNTSGSSYAAQLNPRNVTDETYEIFDLEVPDDRLVRTLVNALDDNVSHWNQAPWQLERTDKENINYLLGDQLDQSKLLDHQARYVDNRLFASVRSILAYATGQLAKPSVLPSKTDDRYKRIAKNLEVGLYQHALDHDVNAEFRLGLKNLIVRKRGCVKLRYDGYCGPFGDIMTENVDVADVIIDRFGTFGGDPNIYQRQRCTIEELIAKFPDKQKEIYSAFGFKRGVYSQMSRMVTYYECWFSFWTKDKENQGLCWFLPNSYLILGKMKNPNWMYEGSDRKQRLVNMTSKPIKPYVWLNYLNIGRSFIDETCLFDQAVPLQDILNKRGRQIVENADYANPRMLIDKRVMEEGDAKKFVNKHPKTIGMVDTSSTGNDLAKGALIIAGQQLPSFVFQDKLDARNEIDAMMGTPSVFRGEVPTHKSPTLGQDVMLKNQAGALQDDLVEVVNRGYRDYYTKLLQMMRVYLPNDYWMMSRGNDGEFTNIALSDDNLDTNVRITIQTDSTLPLDKQSQRATALQLAQIPGRIDNLSLYEMLGLPDAEKLAARVARSQIDPINYMESIEQKLYNAEAEADIAIVTAGRTPEERDDYNEDYLNHWNLFLISNRFERLGKQAQKRLTDFLMSVADKAARTESLRNSILNPAGITTKPLAPPAPQQSIDYKLIGQLDPQQTANVAAGQAGGSPPAVTNPGQFGA